MAVTKLENIINPEVMADMISTEVMKKIRFSALAVIDTTLEGQAGNTITIPSYKYIGDAEDLEEGVAIESVLLEATTTSATVKEVGKSVTLSDTVLNSGYGDPLNNAVKQISEAIAQKVDNDSLEALKSAVLSHDVSEADKNTISYNAVVEALDKFGEADDEPKVLFIHSSQASAVRKDPDFVKRSEMSEVPLFSSGTIGELGECQVVLSDKINYNPYTGKYTNIIAKKESLFIFIKERVKIETQRFAKARATDFVGTEHYVAELLDQSRAIKLITKGTLPLIISTKAVAGVTAPVTGATPVTAVTADAQFTGAVVWSPADATFDAATIYTATITLTPKTGYTLTGVGANSFTVAGATATNAANSGVITAVFPATQAGE